MSCHISHMEKDVVSDGSFRNGFLNGLALKICGHISDIGNGIASNGLFHGGVFAAFV